MEQTLPSYPLNAEAKMELDELHSVLADAKSKYHAGHVSLELVWRRQMAVDKFWERHRSQIPHLWAKETYDQ